MYILGISAFYYDSASVLICDGVIIAAAQEERFTRKKHDPAFPSNAIRYCLSEAGISIENVSIVAFYDKPLLKFERLLGSRFEKRGSFHLLPRDTHCNGTGYLLQAEQQYYFLTGN